jgi:methylglyoxal/glyoxal reductase
MMNDFKITSITGTTTLNNGVEMPYLGLGTWQSNEGPEVVNAVHYALDCGYRLIDTASFYQNEKGIGEALKEHDIDRKELFITTKVWNTDQGYDETLKAFDQSLNLLQTDYLDLYLVHWPVTGKYLETWKALEKLYADGKVRAIGVSNFLQVHLDKLLPETTITPMVNQMEFHPHLIQQSLLDFCKSQDILYQAWSPIMQGGVFDILVLKKISKKYRKNAAQITLRWDLQKGVATIPKSANQARIGSNADLFDFELTSEEMIQIDALDKNHRYGFDPMNV